MLLLFLLVTSPLLFAEKCEIIDQQINIRDNGSSYYPFMYALGTNGMVVLARRYESLEKSYFPTNDSAYEWLITYEIFGNYTCYSIYNVSNTVYLEIKKHPEPKPDDSSSGDDTIILILALITICFSICAMCIAALAMCIVACGNIIIAIGYSLQPISYILGIAVATAVSGGFLATNS